MREGRTAILFKKGSSRSAEAEWLGPESHMPNLSRELRRREARGTSVSFGWIASAVFAAGVAAGCLAVSLFDRRFQRH
ncbi:MAG: hypothetical protein E8D47_11690 [Nitrospira sp.]|jgi:hypothetical protein|nr:MAG: hypothetical protein E8D47_11690 [Nitrospira sp.]